MKNGVSPNSVRASDMLNYYSIIVGVPGYAVPYACTAATSLFVVGTVLRVFDAPSMLGFRGIYSGEFGD